MSWKQYFIGRAHETYEICIEKHDLIDRAHETYEKCVLETRHNIIVLL